ncbi:hypothetical protein [Helicobacter suis]|uniref:hypothetical protein n=1 Tax=Helicobacter suis TaxID=104628 RepID=UPI002209F7A0|nr:hypothetical protein HSHS1_06790 [Helicobacter suis HS1]
MKNRYTALLGTFLVGYFFVACSVYETSDLPSENIAKKEKKEKVKKAKDKKKPPKEIPTSKAPETPKKPESNTALTEEIKKLSAAIATNAEKVDALDAKFNTQEAQKQNTQQDTPPKNINIEKSNRFLIGYGISDTRVKSDQDSDAREAAYFNARRMLKEGRLCANQEVLVMGNQKTYQVLSLYYPNPLHKIPTDTIECGEIGIISLGSKNLTDITVGDTITDARIRQLVRVQYNFTNQQRHVIDRLIYTMQNEDTLH